jgi:hypothetical protein
MKIRLRHGEDRNKNETSFDFARNTAAFVQVSGRVAARTISFWSRLVAVYDVACLRQALVENIPWRDARLAYDSIASIACPMLAARSRAAGSLKLCRGIVPAGVEFMF